MRSRAVYEGGNGPASAASHAYLYTRDVPELLPLGNSGSVCDNYVKPGVGVRHLVAGSHVFYPRHLVSGMHVKGVVK